MDKKVRVEPCDWRYVGKCNHSNSVWYGNKVVGDKKTRCEECELYKNGKE